MRYEDAVLGGVYNAFADLAAWLYRLNQRGRFFHMYSFGIIHERLQFKNAYYCLSSIATVITRPS